ncbi:hypothetical protein [Schumannella luteola]
MNARDHGAVRMGRVAVVLATLALAGCTVPPPPPGLTDSEVRAVIEESNRVWWEAIAPGEQMPHNDPVEYMVEGGPDLQWQCVDSVGIEGIRFSENRQLTVTDPSAELVFQRALFECNQKYPYLIESPEAAGFYSQEQLDYLAVAFERRVVPCLESLGYAVGEPPEGSFTAPHLGWLPYYNLSPPTTNLAYLGVRCPPPSIVTSYLL